MALHPSEFTRLSQHREENVSKRMIKKYDETERVDMAMGSDKQILQNGSEKTVQLPDLPRSLFSNYHLFNLKNRSGGNYPLKESEIAEQSDLFKNVKPTDLVDNPQGGLIYNPNNFLYLKDLNRVPLNRLITLNKFSYPCFDNIHEYSQEPPIATLLTFATNEYNKLSEIMTISAGLRWVEKKSEIKKMDIQGDPSGFSAGGGMAGRMTQNILKFTSPEFGQNAIQGQNRLKIDPYHDQNKVYGDVDVIDANHLRDRGLDFEQSIALTFKFEMQSHQGISQKSAFIDLLSNILLMCTHDAKFWGGARYWSGGKPSQMAMNLRMLNPRDYQDFLNKAHVQFKGWLGSLGDLLGGGGGNALDTIKNVAKNALNLGIGKMLDGIGRPSIPFTDSLLTGNPVGVYHLTIGNPFNPIMSIGNLINDGQATIKFGDELGYEDFPTSIEVEFKLKHAMPRGRADIEAMFNGGSRTYWKPEQIMSKKHGQGGGTKLLGDFVKSGIDSAHWGDFTKDAVVRNSQSVYSFVKNEVVPTNLKNASNSLTK